MRLVEADLGEKHAKTGIWIGPQSDIHIGHPEYNGVMHQRELDWLGDADNHYGILAGDMCETAIIGSVGDVYDQVLPPQKQADQVIRQYSPYRAKLLGACGGNHEARVYRATGFDPAMIYASGLGIPYQAEGMLLRIRFGSSRGKASDKSPCSIYTLYFTHGWGAARTIGAKLKNVGDLARVVNNCDIYIGGHNHQPGYYPMDAYEVDAGHGTVVRRTQHFISLGSTLDYAGYAQVKGLTPTTMTFPKIWLGDTNHGRQIKVVF